MPDRPVYIEVKSANVPPVAGVRYSWWATVDRHPFSDHVGYESEDAAKAAAESWVNTYYPEREFSYESVRTA